MTRSKRATAATVTPDAPHKNGVIRLYHTKMIQEWIIPIVLAAVADFVFFILPWLLALVW